MSIGATATRQPWAAVLLSLLATGLGHIYCGRIVRGLFLFLASGLFAPFVVLAALEEPLTSVLVQLIVLLLTVAAFYVYAVVDAFFLARRLGSAYELRDYNRGIVYTLFILVGLTYPPVIVHYLRSNVYEAFLIPSASEAPNLLPGDRLLVNKLVVQRRPPQRGDLVVFRAPPNRTLNWIKRIIALPGDTVAVRAADVFVNGKKLEHERQPRSNFSALPASIEGEPSVEVNGGRRYNILLGPSAEPIPDFAEAKVPAGTVFVLGDNRNDSTDSRQLGFIPLGEIIGLFEFIYLPAADWNRFGAQP